MKIISLTVKDDNSNKYYYQFKDKTMIYSKKNSKGKTTLIRFALYALGYQIPATEGIGDFEKLEFELKIFNGDKEMNIFRKANVVQVTYDKVINNYVLPEQENELHSIIFKINNVTILNNLLAVYYIDQEKGWTLLNRGKIIGNIRFNIEEFIAGISNININDLVLEKKVLNSEIKKYRYFRNVIDINSEFEDEDTELPEYSTSNMDTLLNQQNELEIKLKNIKKKRKQLEQIIKTNDGFSEMIENYGLMISYKGDVFQLTKDKLIDFEKNQSMLQLKLNDYIIEEEKIKKELDKILSSINEKNTLFNTDDLLDEMQKNIEHLGISNIKQIDKILKQLNNKRNTINCQMKDKLVFNNQQLYDFYETIILYSKELEVYDYISDKNPRFVLTNKLKGLSGRVMAQMCYIFKLSYIKAIEKNFNVILPIIIDSPRTSELSEESSDAMMNILKRDFANHQIITASIYKCDVINFDIMNLENGVMSSDFEIDSDTTLE